MRIKRIILLSLAITGIFFTRVYSQDPVQIREEPLTIPTYEVRPPEKAPLFYHGRAYQGAEGHIYPYPFQDELTDQRVEKEYNAVYLENQYIKVCVLPELGGRILYARDKSNGYDFIYRQHVIKPALIGMLGAWISGGIEWDLPHHHRARVYEPVDYTIEENADGSKTLWIGELELRDRMRWTIGLTLYPGKSYFEAEVKLFNRNPMAHSFLSWANVATHANDNYQILFPPSTNFVTYHSKTQFTTWPKTNGIWRNTDYTSGVDLSWWKNHPSPSSFFAWNYQNDFFGGYDHGREAGVAYVANHHVAPGKKFFLWGPGFGEDTHGAMWNKILTEKDGPYVELMAGGYSDNQPDYSWIQPYETKKFKWHWYPIRQIDGMKKANLNGALNVEADGEQELMISANATSRMDDARLVMKHEDQILFEETVSLAPDKPYQTTIQSSPDILDQAYRLILYDADDKKQVAYHHQPAKEQPRMPDPVQPPKSPKEIETVEELYLTGLRIEQFHNPSLEPYPYYEEALRRDPGNYRVNRSLGILYYERGMMDQAHKHLTRAVERITRKYTSPRDGEAHYYLGLTEKYLDNHQQAYDALYKATWDHRFSAPAYFQLAQLDSRAGNFDKALEHLDRSLETNRINNKAIAMKAAVLRHMKRYDKALETLQPVFEDDPLHPWAGYEKHLAKKMRDGKATPANPLQLNKKLQANKTQTYLELASNYMNCGLWQDARQVLNTFLELNLPEHPMIHYYLGYTSDRMGQRDQAKDHYERAAAASPDYCFPFRLESQKILQHVLQVHPNDHRTHYYLGNLMFYYQQRNQAMEHWEASKDLDSEYPYLFRNLGMAYNRVRNNPEKAIENYRMAIQIQKQDPRFDAELMAIYQKADVSFEERLDLLHDRKDVIKLRDDALSRFIQTLLHVKKYDQAIDYLKEHHFKRWEGGGNIRNIYVDAYLLRGLDQYHKGKYKQALEDFQQALRYPENIQAAQSYHGGRRGQIHYFAGMTCEAMDKTRQAREHYKKAVSSKKRGEATDMHYYEARALQNLGMETKAHEIFLDIMQNGKKKMERTGSMSFFAKFGEQQAASPQQADAHYLIGLGYLGAGNAQKAHSEFEKALQMDMDHIWARYYLNKMQNHP